MHSKAASKDRRKQNLLLLNVLHQAGPGETIELWKVADGWEAEMTTRPNTPGLPLFIAGGHAGRTTGNVAVPDLNLCPREAACRKDPAFI
ncbi:hypothetical protein [Nonomuraea sp. NEAU-A123]|uniref:hypothetical protein n=1 Tax=Nonomuraea sp. NEAU-A123 TaxID=2839649 RepID=UPI001BE415E1|nr:hypothetical protein [Nonomuraea sp. NEAU-A123]MBT2225838.1 hypothetical protein [Nonomuraea sp. NEAU-A123]